MRKIFFEWSHIFTIFQLISANTHLELCQLFMIKLFTKKKTNLKRIFSFYLNTWMMNLSIFSCAIYFYYYLPMFKTNQLKFSTKVKAPKVFNSKLYESSFCCSFTNDFVKVSDVTRILVSFFFGTAARFSTKNPLLT